MKNILIFVLFTLLFFSCSSNKKRNEDVRYMTTENIEMVNNFPKTISLKNPQKVEVDVQGFTGFKIIDSLLVLATKGDKGIFAFYNLQDNRLLNRFVNIGNSEEELAFPTAMATGTDFYKDKDSLYMIVFDKVKGHLLTMNVTKSIKNKKLSLSSIQEGFSNDVFNFARLSDGRYFVKEIDNQDTQQKRMIRDVRTKENSIPSILKKLNAASVKVGEDFNILSTLTRITPDGKVVEMPIGLNYLNIYKLDGSFQKTICVGDELDDIDDIMDKNRAKRKYTFSDIRIFKDFFGVVYINEEDAKYQDQKGKMPSILFFNFDGKPLAEIKMERPLTSFDIDFSNGFLYTFNVQTGEFLKYEFSKVLE